MEIRAKVYVIAKSPDALEEAGQVLSTEMRASNWWRTDTFEPDAVLKLAQTWYGFATNVEPAVSPAEWLGCLRRCAGILGKDGAMVVEFTSPDHPDSYLEYGTTTPSGNASIQTGRYSLIGYRRANGNDDLQTVCSELMSGRTAADRRAASKREEKRLQAQATCGDFKIKDSVMQKYLGNDEEVILPDGITEIGDSAFVDMRMLKRHILECEDYDAPEMAELTIPEGVRKIGYYAIAYCYNLEIVHLPESLAEIESRAFEGCENLKEIRIPGNVKELAEFTFFLCSELRKVILPEGLLKIGQGAFWSCMSLRKIEIPGSVEEIGAQAFNDCIHLEQIILHEGLIRIGPGAFEGCRSLKIVRIPKSVTVIDGYAFEKGCQVVR